LDPKPQQVIHSIKRLRLSPSFS